MMQVLKNRCVIARIMKKRQRERKSVNMLKDLEKMSK